ncbi:MAG: sigma-70 family RNA polymerase sigma factor [Vicinamibacterales bacterium]
MSSDPADAGLIDAARRGDPAALDALLARHQPRIYRFGLKMCRDPRDAEDVLQDTMMAMARTIGEFRGASSLTTWLYAIAWSFCVRRRRKSRFAPARELSLEAVMAQEGERLRDPAPAPDEVAMAAELRTALHDAIQALEPSQRDVLVLRDIEGLSAPEVAEVLRISVPAVKSRLHRARLAVRARLAPRLGNPPVPPAGTTCLDVLNLLTRHLEGDISPEQCSEMERHVAQCERCEAACQSLRHTLALCRSVDAPSVPEPIRQRVREQIQALLAERA